MEAIRNQYAKVGVETYYETNADTYINPHEPIITELIHESTDIIDYGDSVLDLCCGNGLATKVLEQKVKHIVGNDPYMCRQYTEQTNRYCYDYDFKQLAQSCPIDKVDTIICSFALHLCDESLLPNVLYNLSLIADTLVIITPNKKPTINMFWELQNEIVKERVRLRIYKTKYTNRLKERY